jgi:triosephosphate isomerase (TIM)
MREKIVAGNWKMNLDIPSAERLASDLVSKISSMKIDTGIKVIICPGYVSLYSVFGIIKDSLIKLGAQNMFYEDEGAYTGEVSPSMIASAGCEYVIIGHSERRKYFHETDEIINIKVKKAIEAGHSTIQTSEKYGGFKIRWRYESLSPILCVGETLEEREAGDHFNIVRDQVEKDLNEINDKNIKKVIIAYEPVWAIGTGKNATPEQAEEMHLYIREVLKEKYNEEISSNISILYGGSVNEKNAKEIFAMENIDGGLVGGASLKAESFIKIIEAV